MSVKRKKFGADFKSSNIFDLLGYNDFAEMLVTGIKFIKFTCKMVGTVFALTFKRFHQHRNLSHQLSVTNITVTLLKPQLSIIHNVYEFRIVPDNKTRLKFNHRTTLRVIALDLNLSTV